MRNGVTIGFFSLPEEKKDLCFITKLAGMRAVAYLVKTERVSLEEATELFDEIHKCSLPPELLGSTDNCFWKDHGVDYTQVGKYLH